MVIEIKQTWWHIEEIYFPHAGRKIRQVMDIYIDEQYLPISLDSNIFLGFRVYARNANNKELAYLEKNDGSNIKFIVNLGSLDIYPGVPEEDNKNLRHVKIEFEYILMDPDISNQISKGILAKIFNFIRPKKEGNFSIRGKIQPEFYVTMPLGWRIGKVKLLDFNDDREGNYCLLKKKYISDNDDKSEILELEIPFVSIFEGKRKYNYLISNPANENNLDQNDDRIPIYVCSYIAELSNKIVGISIIPFFYLIIDALFIISIFYSCFYCASILNLGISAGLSYLISLLAYCYFYTSFIKDGYSIPHKLYFMLSILGSLIVIMLIFLIAIFNNNNPEQLIMNVDTIINLIY